MIFCRSSATLLLLTIMCLMPAPALAQVAPDKKDPQSTYEPRSKPSAGQKYLEKYVGEWSVIKTFYPRSGGPFKVLGECKQTMIHDGRFLRSAFVFDQAGSAKTTGLGLLGFEAGSGLFTSVWTDSRATRMSFRQSKDKFNGEEIVLSARRLGGTGKHALPAPSQSLKRTTARSSTANSARRRRQGTAGDGVGDDAKGEAAPTLALEVKFDGVAVVAEVEVLQREVGDHGLVGVFLTGIVRQGLGQEVDRAVGEDEVGAAGVIA